MTDRYRTPRAGVSAEIEVKRSRFLARIEPVTSEEAARAVIEQARAEHWDARHHCSAFVLGPDARVRRSNDDGEPSGTAGMPMLDVLVGSGLTDVVAVVTRWFGGTLMGTGGLVKAYGDAVRAGLDDVVVDTYERAELLDVDLDLADVGRVENVLRAAGVVVRDVDYGVVDDGVVEGRGGAREASSAPFARVHVAVTPQRRAQVDAALAEATSGSAHFVARGGIWVPMP